MKTPEEIKKGLWCCSQDDECGICPYANGECHNNKVKADALGYIQQLEADSSRLNDTIRSLTEQLNAAHEETAKAMRERDAAVKDIPRACGYCKHYEISFNGATPDHDCKSPECYNISGVNTGWEWRGVCPDNTEVQGDD